MTNLERETQSSFKKEVLERLHHILEDARYKDVFEVVEDEGYKISLHFREFHINTEIHVGSATVNDTKDRLEVIVGTFNWFNPRCTKYLTDKDTYTFYDRWLPDYDSPEERIEVLEHHLLDCVETWYAFRNEIVNITDKETK